MAPGLLGRRGPGLLGRSWQAALVLDDFSLKICLKNVLFSKEGKALSRPERGGDRVPSSLFIDCWCSTGRTDCRYHQQPHHLVEPTIAASFPWTWSLFYAHVCRCSQMCSVCLLRSRHCTGAGDAKMSKTRLLFSQSSQWGTGEQKYKHTYNKVLANRNLYE